MLNLFLLTVNHGMYFAHRCTIPIPRSLDVLLALIRCSKCRKMGASSPKGHPNDTEVKLHKPFDQRCLQQQPV